MTGWQQLPRNKAMGLHLNNLLCLVPSRRNQQTLDDLAEGSEPGPRPSWAHLPQPTFLLGPGAHDPENTGLETRCSRLGMGLGQLILSACAFMRPVNRCACGQQACVWLRVLPSCLSRPHVPLPTSGSGS